MNKYAIISDKDIVSDSNSQFELEKELEELKPDEYKELFKSNIGGRAMIVEIIYLDDR
tara:strand:+ start:528 stop:701 length:174 start_codon:yes stop_codon:yes gene_type:complete